MLVAAVSVVLVFPMFAMLNSGNFWLVPLALILGNPIIQASMYGPIGAFLAEKFETQDRYTEVSLTFQLGSVIGAGNAPLMTTMLMGLSNGGKTNNIAWYFIALIAVAAVSVFLSKETRGRTQRAATADCAAIADRETQQQGARL
ncbi:hypothetical protein [Arthrobacter sp. S2(2024)]|uniref:hypothetical protein n=1 Tax=Arthrobacter sp. S2(2024) TaxID=3111911 RepID=UPI002FC751E1